MDSYAFLKTVHVLGVVLFIGNIIVTGWWKVMANRTRDPVIVAFAQRQVTLTDWVFTFGGVVLVCIGAFGNVLLHDMDMSQMWLQTGFVMFTLSGLIWAGILVPLQAKLGRLAREFAGGGKIPEEYWRAERLWLFWGTVDIILPAAVIPFMVWKAV